MWDTKAKLIHDRERYLEREAEFRLLLESTGAKGRDRQSRRPRKRLWLRPAPAARAA
jgi:hypothetical protein